ncbi:hypothetical protein Trydic_g8390 [Trypoxylus dichotomus]
MSAVLLVFCSALAYGTLAEPKPYFYGAHNSYFKLFGLTLPSNSNYGNQIPTGHVPFRRIEDLYTPTGGFPVLNVLAEIPYSIGNTFTVVPMIVVSKETMRMIQKDTPISVSIVYAIPSDPVRVDYVNNDGVIINADGDTVIVESPASQLPIKNVTVLDFPDAEAEPNLEVDEEDEELVNRNPPIVLAPAGIVQSTQPLANVEPFFNSKESPVLTELREESKKRI